MSAPVTEAHKQLVATIVEQAFRFAEGNHKITPLSQLIADSEAKACAELRAEVERLKRDYDYDHKCLHEVRERCELWKQRAERAEAELHALRLVCGTTDADKFSTWVDRANTRAEKAEAELAGIRALANRRNKRDHSADTTHQLVVALDQALDIAQAELAQFRELDTERARMRQIAVDKRIRTPTPQTDEEAGSLIDAEEVVPADFARELEREVATERARLDWLLSRMGGNVLPVNGCVAWTVDVYHYKNQFPSRAAIDAAIKEGA